VRENAGICHPMLELSDGAVHRDPSVAPLY
jgi:hypothetical protein